MFDFASLSLALIFGILQKIVIAGLVLFIGFYLIKKAEALYTKPLKKCIKDDTLVVFFKNLINYLLKGIVIIITISNLGIETASIIAILGAASFAIGLAFQGALSNFAGGILLLVLRPFTVGEFIETDGESGTVEELSLLNTSIVTLDNKVVTIPNGKLSNNNIINYTRKDVRRVDLDFYAGYGENSENIMKIIRSVIDKNPLILNDKEKFVEISNHGSNSVTYTTRVWVKTENYWTVYFEMMKNVKIAFEKENIQVPYQKIDVNLNK